MRSVARPRSQKQSGSLSFALILRSDVVHATKMSFDGGTWDAIGDRVSRKISLTNMGANQLRLGDLGDAELRCLKPLPVQVEYLEEDEYLATFPPAGISMTGGDVREALASLKFEICRLYKLFSKETTLGPIPERRFRVLEQYVGPKGWK